MGRAYSKKSFDSFYKKQQEHSEKVQFKIDKKKEQMENMIKQQQFEGVTMIKNSIRRW